MTRVLYLLFFSLLLVGCNGAKQEESKIQESQKPVEKEVTAMENNELESVNEDTSEKVELPIEKARTVDLKGKEVWEIYDGIEIINVYSEGEKLFVFNDAEKLEDKVISEYEKQEPDGTLMKWGTYIDVFIAQTKDDRPDQSEYYDKLREAVKLIQGNGEKSLIAEKLKEAKEVRTSNN